MQSQHEKYKSRAKRIGISWPDNQETFLNKTLPQWTELYKSDEHLNNVPIHTFDSMIPFIWPQAFKILGSYSLSSNTCCYKAVIITKILGDS